jgi:hypothetical protein
MPGIMIRLEKLEEKIDAALILLRTLVTADDFTYTFSSSQYPNLTKPKRWKKELEWATALASRVPIDEDKFRLSNGLSVPLSPVQAQPLDKFPSGKGDGIDKCEDTKRWLDRRPKTRPKK